MVAHTGGMSYRVLVSLMVFMSLCVSGDVMEDKLMSSSLFPDLAKSRLEIIQHSVMWKAGGCLSTKRSPNGAYMWVKEIGGDISVVVVYIELGDGSLSKVDEFTYREKEIATLSQPVGVEVEGEKIRYYSGGNPVTPRRLLFERVRK